MFADVIVDRVISLDRLAGVPPEAFQNVVLHQATFHIPVVDVGDLELASTRRLQARQHTPHGFVVEIRAGDRELAGWILRLFDDSLDALASVEVSDAEVPEVLAILLSRQHDARSGRLLAERIDAALQGSAEDVVREEHHGAAATREALSEGEGFGDAARLRLVCIEQARDPELLTVAQQPQKLAGMRTARDEHDLRHACLDQRLDAVADHRPVVDRQQVLVGDLSQGMQPAAGATRGHHHRLKAAAAPGWRSGWESACSCSSSSWWS